MMVYCIAKHRIYYISAVSSELLTSCLSTSNFFISHQPTHGRWERVVWPVQTHKCIHVHIVWNAFCNTFFASPMLQSLFLFLSFYFSHIHKPMDEWNNQFHSFAAIYRIVQNDTSETDLIVHFARKMCLWSNSSQHTRHTPSN